MKRMTGYAATALRNRNCRNQRWTKPVSQTVSGGHDGLPPRQRGPATFHSTQYSAVQMKHGTASLVKRPAAKRPKVRSGLAMSERVITKKLVSTMMGNEQSRRRITSSSPGVERSSNPSEK